MIQRELSRQIGSRDTGPPPHSFQTNITHLSLQFYSNTSCKYFYMTRCHQNELRTSSQINDTFLFHRVLKILAGGRIFQISIAWCQIDREIHSFPTMYGKGGGRCGKNLRNQGFRPKIMPKTRFFWGHKSGSSHFRVAWGPLFQRWCQFRYVPQKVWVKSFQMSYGHVR